MTASFAAIWFSKGSDRGIELPLFSSIPASSEVLGFSVRLLGCVRGWDFPLLSPPDQLSVGL